MPKNKMTRHQIRKKLVQIERTNFRQAELDRLRNLEVMSKIYYDIAYLAKIISKLTKDMPKCGDEVDA